MIGNSNEYASLSGRERRGMAVPTSGHRDPGLAHRSGMHAQAKAPREMCWGDSRKDPSFW